MTHAKWYNIGYLCSNPNINFYTNMKKKLVIDTNVFFNLEIDMGLGKAPSVILQNIINAHTKGFQSNVELFMPPRIASEMKTFVSTTGPIVEEFLKIVTIKSPNIDELQFSARIFYLLIAEQREAQRQGIRVSEEQLVQAIGHFGLKTSPFESKMAQEKEAGPFLNKLREKYRVVTRHNRLDSIADLDIIMLAKEINGFVVTSDMGVLNWGREMGAMELDPKNFGSMISSFLNLD